jgi:TPR repeat protein
MYASGEGIPQDYVQAYKWFYLAAATLTEKQVRDEAAKRRDIVAARMTPAQLAEAQKLARDWKKQ